MNNNNFIKEIVRNGVLAAAVLLLFSVVFLMLEIYNGRFWQSDFTVYYKAASRLLSGENMYQIKEDGHYIFKYSPVSALLFIPFTIVNLSIAKYIYWFFLTGIIILNFFLSLNLSNKLFSNIDIRLSGVLLLGALILVVHFQRELHLGQVNQILLLLYLGITYFLGKEKPILIGVMLSLSIFLKPFGLIFIPYLIVKKQFKALAYTALSFVALLFIPALFYDWSIFVQQNMLWFNELVIELGNKQDLMQPANHTIFSVIARYTSIGYLLNTEIVKVIFQILILSALGIFILIFIIKGNYVKNNHIAEMALLISIIPLLSFTSHNAFGFVELTVFIIILALKKLSNILKLVSIIGMIFIGFNYYDIWGANYSSMINNISLVSVGTILLLTTLSICRFKKIV